MFLNFFTENVFEMYLIHEITYISLAFCRISFKIGLHNVNK